MKIIDYEQTHVSFAVQDISYCFWAEAVKSKEIKLAFATAYLKRMGDPSSDADAFALVLDAERCIPSTGFMSDMFEEVVHTMFISFFLSFQEYKKLHSYACIPTTA